MGEYRYLSKDTTPDPTIDYENKRSLFVDACQLFDITDLKIK